MVLIDFNSDSNPNFLNQYQWVFRIPLRNLTPERYPTEKHFRAIDVIEQECLAPILKKSGYFLSKKDKNLLENHFKKAAQNQKILLIIDGFDEMPENSDSNVINLIKMLLNFSRVILTSRPYNLFDLRDKYEFKQNILLEITGFTQNNINHYVKNFFTCLSLPKDE